MTDPRLEAERQFGRGALALQPGTLRRALLLGGAILALVALLAWALMQPRGKPPLEPYLRRGAAAGAAALQADLDGAFPNGAPVAPLLQRLRDLGLACAPPAAEPAWRCIARLQADGRNLTRVRVVVGVVGDRRAALLAEIARVPAGTPD